MVFNNQAILLMLGIESSKDLHGLLERQMFKNRAHGFILSLLATASSRKSEDLLNQEFKYERKIYTRIDQDKSEEQSVISSERVVCFKRNEIIFNNKKSIMINV